MAIKGPGCRFPAAVPRLEAQTQEAHMVALRGGAPSHPAVTITQYANPSTQADAAICEIAPLPYGYTSG